MKALVTGAAGFIGSSIARRLLDDGHEVIGIDGFTEYYHEPLKRRNAAALAGDGFRLIESDLLEVDLVELLHDVEVVFHEAGQPGVRGSWGSGFEPYISRNIAATQALLEAARTAPKLRRFVGASSSSVYGEAESYPTRESDRPQPKSPYGVTKLAAEHLTTLYGRNFGVPTTSLRYFTVYGPRQRPDMAFTRFLRAAIAGDPIRVFGSGEQIRDFTYIDDIVEANLRAATVEHDAGSVFNVAGGGQVSVNEVLDSIGTLTGRPLEVERVGVATGDVFRTAGATELIEEALAWRATTSVADGLRNQYEWAVEAAPVLATATDWN
ncbi:NAD-dependent epimerase/dehydratase family protein [Protaetiibacter intestinalis]|uniref:NAD-dependent epimerase/dehydratase family protein n=1 Tax=Protaetiibacter intestinalis TaxID=2419774 RepID=A0A387B4K6_9MICO|nr:NAD-dependent epimerase/dehydratase family protein [Protaetiibacter intestinalis]AYF97247.1 NAD-dependent epimerase/dehydratase family protein [Protaetiibacter intestinalis]